MKVTLLNYVPGNVYAIPLTLFINYISLVRSSSRVDNFHFGVDGNVFDYQKNICFTSMNVLVVGAGGTGSQIVDSLANRSYNFQLRSLTVVDFDYVEQRNTRN